MASTLYKITSDLDGTDSAIKQTIRFFKGKTTVQFDLSELSTAIKLWIDFNDGSEILTKDYSFGGAKITDEIIEHDFLPITSAYNVIYFPSIIVTFANFSKLQYQAPVKIAQESFYTDYESLDIGAAQFVDDSNNSVYLKIDSTKGDVINLRLT